MTPSKEAAMKNKLMLNNNGNGGQRRKVKGMMGLAVHHNKNEAVDALQTLDPEFNEDEIFKEDKNAANGGVSARRKAKAADDFGLSSDEEQTLEDRKN